MRTMKKIIGGLILTGMISIGVAAQTPAPAQITTAPKHMAKTASLAKSDSDIQADIQKRLAAAPKLKSENIKVSVSGGVATFTGAVQNAGSKGGVSSLAKAAGARSVVNNISIEKVAPHAKTAAPIKK